MALRIALIILGIVGIVDTAVLSMYSNLNLGVVLPAASRRAAADNRHIL